MNSKIKEFSNNEIDILISSLLFFAESNKGDDDIVEIIDNVCSKIMRIKILNNSERKDGV